jgi:hypothetical protein
MCPPSVLATGGPHPMLKRGRQIDFNPLTPADFSTKGQRSISAHPPFLLAKPFQQGRFDGRRSEGPPSWVEYATRNVSPGTASGYIVFPSRKNSVFIFSKVYCYLRRKKKFVAVRRVGLMTHHEYRVDRLFPVTWLDNV